jgi:hypothetical protein
VQGLLRCTPIGLEFEEALLEKTGAIEGSPSLLASELGVNDMAGLEVDASDGDPTVAYQHAPALAGEEKKLQNLWKQVCPEIAL